MTRMRRAARDLLLGLGDGARRRGIELEARGGLASATFRVEDDELSFTVVCELSGEEMTTVCTCGASGCPHVVAALNALSEELAREAPPAAAAPTAGATGVRPSPPPAALAQEARKPARASSRTDVARLAEAVDGLVRSTCAHGLLAPSAEREASLSELLALLADQDMPDLRRAVAGLRRELTAPVPDPAVAATAMLRLRRVAEMLRNSGSVYETRSRLSLPEGAERREEVRLLEVARHSRRTPYGDRRDTSYFLDLDGRELFREIAVSKLGQVPRMSQGPYPRLLVGNLVAIEGTFSPRRIRMLQYSTAGFADRAHLDKIEMAATTRVEALYETFARTTESHDATLDPVVLFAPRETVTSARGVLLADAAGALLPLSRAAEPALSEAVDLLATQGRIVAVVGSLVLGPRLLALLPLAVLLEQDGTRVLRQIR